jgi:hypothetical protein
MVNGSFVFGMDGDDPSVFERTVEWAISQGIETATFHILTPYPGTGLHDRMTAEGRITSQDWDRYDTRHVVYQPAGMTPDELEAGYWRAYRDFYRWGSIFRGAASKERWPDRLRHVAYAGGWKKLEPMWDLLIRAKRATSMLPVLDGVLSGFGEYRPGRSTEIAAPTALDESGNRADHQDDQESSHVLSSTQGSETVMDRQNRVPLKLLLPIEATSSAGEEAPETTPAESIEVSPVHSSPDAPRPRFVPLALAIDMGQTGPIGSLTTTTVGVESVPSQSRPSWKPRRGTPAPSTSSGRRHLRLLPGPDA